ncbi:hypothetical protein MMC26_007108 [Xylographa opegraphella]|nr:hypothetical protein [Xylographa opegraphella]
MASRMFHGSKPSRKKEEEEQSARRTAESTKRSSVVPPLVNTSKIPTHTSMFSRHRAKREEEKSQPPKQTASGSSKDIGTTSEGAFSSRTDSRDAATPKYMEATASTRAQASGAITNPGQPVPSGRNKLRRKGSSNEQRYHYAQSTATSSSVDSEPVRATAQTVSSPGGYSDPFPGSILGISLPTISHSTSQIPVTKSTPTAYATSNSRMATYVPRHLPHKLSTQDLPPPHPGYVARSSSASTRASISPGPFSRTSTPTSISSHSPGITLAPKFIPRLKTPSSPTKTRPPVTRRNLGVAASKDEIAEDQGLPPLRESSSSSSTVKAAEQIERTEIAQMERKTRLAPPPPTPPLRLSSKRGPSARGPASSAPGAGRGRTVVKEDQLDSARRPSVSQSRIPALSTGRTAAVPPRPSREGTPILEKERPSPVIQSNLNHLATSGHTRRESIEKAKLVSPAKADDRHGRPSLQRSPSNTSTISKKPFNMPPPAQARAQSPHLHPRERSRTRGISSLRTEDLKQTPKLEPSPMADSPSKSPSRFGLFIRRGKSPADASNYFGDKPTKKGPAAGTGHEGYGKYAKRGRSGSISTTASRGRSTSTDRSSVSYRPSSSRKSSFAGDEKPELDDFYKERLEPVIIGGGGRIKENRNSGVSLYRTSSGESSTSISSSVNFEPSVPIRNRFRDGDVSTDQGSLDTSQRISPALLPPSKPPGQAGSSSAGHLTLAHRRSLHRSQVVNKAEPINIPPPINTQVATPAGLDSTALDSFDAVHSSVPWSDSSLNDLSEGHEGNWLKPKRPQRVKLPSKWNFFQRAQHSPKHSAKSASSAPIVTANELPVAISKMPEPHSVPHYAIMDGSEQEDNETLEDLLRDIEDDLELRNPEAASKSEVTTPITPQQERQYSMLLPSPPKFPAEFTQAPMPNLRVAVPAPRHSEEHQPVPAAVTPVRNRLQQVGRIPRVISKRDRLHNPPPKSFSRPFTRPPVVEDKVSVPTSIPEVPAIPERFPQIVQTEPLPSAPWTGYPFIEPKSAPPTNGMLFNLDGEREFLSFSDRKGSAVSGSSSSGVLSLAGMTALLPRPESLLKEDEVWNEYDELLDHVASPLSVQSSWSGKDDIINSFPAVEESESTSTKERKKESPIIVSPRSSNSTAMAPSPPRRPVISVSTAPVETLQLPSPQRSDFLPSTPMSFSEIYAGYANRSSAGLTVRESVSSGSHYSSHSVASVANQPAADDDPVKRYTQVMADKLKVSLGSPDTFRFSALMTARWLSFDRVLFSPVQEEIRNNRQDRVLVLDGLGNDDWSSYCALTFPTAIVYNLGAPRPLSETKRDNASWQPPSNHRQIHHANIAHPFPFPKGFFSAVVFRFPVANSEAALRNAVAECKRVLRPGGYLEMCILDMDLVNMGNRARRAIRGLKVRMQIADPGVSLSPTSDNVQKMLGRRGFENLNRCVVGVPVAGSLAHSPTGSLDDMQAGLGDLLRGPAAGGAAPITKMVAQVGRWWWSRCYERSVVAEDDAEGSLWHDRALLRECEKRDTGFRLVICYAQKPVNARRRTVSV